MTKERFELATKEEAYTIIVRPLARVAILVMLLVVACYAWFITHSTKYDPSYYDAVRMSPYGVAK